MMFLEQDEIHRLTGKVQRGKQKAVLDALGVRYVENGIGELVVSRSHVERVLAGDGNDGGAETTPNFDALRKVS